MHTVFTGNDTRTNDLLLLVQFEANNSSILVLTQTDVDGTQTSTPVFYEMPSEDVAKTMHMFAYELSAPNFIQMCEQMAVIVTVE